jgi:hypothetical protein
MTSEVTRFLSIAKSLGRPPGVSSTLATSLKYRTTAGTRRGRTKKIGLIILGFSLHSLWRRTFRVSISWTGNVLPGFGLQLGVYCELSATTTTTDRKSYTPGRESEKEVGGDCRDVALVAEVTMEL